MPLPAAALHAARTLVTRVAQSDTAREIAKTTATAAAETLTQKALQRLDGSGPTVRTSEIAGAETRMAPRGNRLRAAAPQEENVTAAPRSMIRG